jgi:DNA-binding NtrC family response regulator
MDAAARPLHERVVLVVDDEEAVCHLTARILTDAGFRVVEARNGSEAVALLATLNGTVQLVVSDNSMPEMTGVELAGVMASRWPTTPVLLISGEGGPPADYRGRFLPKPFSPDALLEAASGLLSLQKH